jgi:TRAP-type C4-dicarboxylate transport system substrate-binding protein
VLKKKALLITFFSFQFCVAYLTILPEVSHSKKQYLIKFATVAPEGSTWMKYMRGLDRALRAKSDGQIGFRLYAGGIAGDELDVLRKIRIGQLHASALSGVGMAPILPMVRVLDLPFLFRSYQEIDLVHNELRDFFSEHFRRNGFELLAWAEIGNVHLFSKEPIQRMSDLSKLKIWTWSGDPISKETFSVMGTHPIPLSVTDVITALNTGMIDTVYAPPLGALALQWNAYVKYMMSLPLAHSTGAFLISNNYFNKIPNDLSRILRNELEQTVRGLTRDLRGQSEESISLIKKSGLNILPMPSGSELKEFYSIHNQVAKRLVGRVYPKSLLDQVYEILKRGREQEMIISNEDSETHR